ncbi:MAG: hypothetical protein IKM43_01085 [Clostridia bacterium]|nr:hypothetical protein [Clostridia bacterium]
MVFKEKPVTEKEIKRKLNENAEKPISQLIVYNASDEYFYLTCVTVDGKTAYDITLDREFDTEDWYNAILENNKHFYVLRDNYNKLHFTVKPKNIRASFNICLNVKRPQEVLIRYTEVAESLKNQILTAQENLRKDLEAKAREQAQAKALAQEQEKDETNLSL